MILAICDDNPAELAQVKILCREYAGEKKTTLELLCFSSAANYLKSGPARSPDALFLDIYMDGMDGLSLAHKLIKQGNAPPIVLVTNSTDHYPDGFEIGAVHYLLKPVKKHALYQALDRIFSGQRQAEERCITFTSNRREVRIPLKNIIYVEVYGHRTQLVTTAGVFPLSVTLAEAIQLMDDPGFLQCFRSYYINMAHISHMNDDNFTMSNGDSVHIARRTASAIKDQYMDFLFRNSATPGGQPV